MAPSFSRLFAVLLEIFASSLEKFFRKISFAFVHIVAYLVCNVPSMLGPPLILSPNACTHRFACIHWNLSLCDLARTME